MKDLEGVVAFVAIFLLRENNRRMESYKYVSEV
jgi:hypothetical protein